MYHLVNASYRVMKSFNTLPAAEKEALKKPHLYAIFHDGTEYSVGDVVNPSQGTLTYVW